MPSQTRSSRRSLSVGRATQRRTGVGWASLRDLPPPATSQVDVHDVDVAFEAIAEVAGAGAVERHRQVEACSAPPRRRSRCSVAALARGTFVRARSSRWSWKRSRRRRGCRGGRTPGGHAARLPGPWPQAVLGSGDKSVALQQFRLEIGRPIQPMLAQTAPKSAEALERTGRAAVEWKLDGIRVQVHRTATTYACSPGPSTMSPTACPRWSRLSARSLFVGSP